MGVWLSLILGDYESETSLPAREEGKHNAGLLGDFFITVLQLVRWYY